MNVEDVCGGVRKKDKVYEDEGGPGIRRETD